MHNLPPERIKRKSKLNLKSEFDEVEDIDKCHVWNLGILAYEIMFGMSPFEC